MYIISQIERVLMLRYDVRFLGIPKNTSVIYLLFFIVSALSGFSQSPENEIRTYFNSIRMHQNVSTKQMVEMLKNDIHSLAFIRPYYRDSLSDVRLAAVTLVSQIGRQSVAPEVKQTAVLVLTSAWNGNDSGVIGLSATALTHFDRASFTIAVKDSLRAFLTRVPSHYDKLVRLVGYLHMDDQVSVIRAQLQGGVLKSKSFQWSARLALCRLGDEGTMEYVLTRVQKLGVSDDVVYEVFPDLIYTRHPTAINYLANVLQSDSYKCGAADPESNASVPCAYRVMELLAPIVKNGPLTTDASGDINTNDYPRALADLRAWFKKNEGHVQTYDDRF